MLTKEYFCRAIGRTLPRFEPSLESPFDFFFFLLRVLIFDFGIIFNGYSLSPGTTLGECSPGDKTSGKSSSTEAKRESLDTDSPSPLLPPDSSLCKLGFCADIIFMTSFYSSFSLNEDIPG